MATYPVGLVVASACLYPVRPTIAVAFAVVGLAGYALNLFQLSRLTGAAEEYEQVMRLKYGASLSFVGFLVGCLAWIGTT